VHDHRHYSCVEGPNSIAGVSAEAVSVDSASRILAEVEIVAERIPGSYGPREYDVLTMEKLPRVAAQITFF
jgi:hypothetical protein